jgi:hypothetical protein
MHKELTMDMSEITLGIIALAAFLWMLREWNNAD